MKQLKFNYSYFGVQMTVNKSQFGQKRMGKRNI